MATRQKRVVQRANPIHVSSMSDDAPEAVTPVKSQKKSKSKKIVFDEPGMGDSEGLVDPRPRHKLELRAHIEQLDSIKNKRESMGKSKAEKIIRRELTAQLAELETVFRTRVNAELEQYLSALSGEAKQREEASAISKLNYKKSWYVSRNKHTLGKRR